MRKRQIITLFISLSAALLIMCRKEAPSTLPLSSFIVELNEGAENIFPENRTRYSIKYSDNEFILPATANQTIERSSHDDFSTEAILQCGIQNLRQAGNERYFLESTRYLDTGNPLIYGTAGQFSRSNDPVTEVSLYVYKRISDKKTGIPFLPASVILRQGAGDCTEHSILTAALLRALHIPARCVVGIILTDNFQGKRNVFVYHMWVEAFYRGRWVLVDSTRPEDIRHNRYIAFTWHPMTTEMPMSYLTAMSALTGLSITRLK